MKPLRRVPIVATALRRLAALAIICSCGETGCVSLYSLQSARTLDRGRWEIGPAIGTGVYFYGPPVTRIEYGAPIDEVFRIGVSPRWEIGFRFPMLPRLDVKHSFLQTDRFALAAELGVASTFHLYDYETKILAPDATLLWSAEILPSLSITLGAKDTAIAFARDRPPFDSFMNLWGIFATARLCAGREPYLCMIAELGVVRANLKRGYRPPDFYEGGRFWEAGFSLLFGGPFRRSRVDRIGRPVSESKSCLLDGRPAGRRTSPAR